MKQTAKTTFKKLAASALAFAFGFSLLACTSEAANNSPDTSPTPPSEPLIGSAYLAIDINPSVELVIENGVVTSINAVNDDASVLLSGEDFIGMTTEEVASEIVSLAEDMGYLNENNTSVKITVASDDEEYAEEVETDATEGAESGSDMAQVNKEPRSADGRTCRKLKAEDPELYKDITPAKVRLIEAIMRYDETMTFEIGATMELSALVDLLEGYVEEYGELVDSELKKEFEARRDAAKLEKERAIAESYGEEYLAQWERVQALRAAVREMKKGLENAKLSSAHITELTALFGLSDTTLISETDEVTLEQVDEYFDKYFVGKKAQSKFMEEAWALVEEKIEEILDSYDEDDYVLTEEDLAALETVWGEALEVETFEALEEFLKEQEEALKALKEEIEATLTQDQKAAIEQIKTTLKDIKEQVRKDMEDLIHEKKEEIHEEKQEKAGDRFSQGGKEEKVPA